MREYGVNPRHTEHARTHDHDDLRRKALSDTAAGGNRAIHKSTESIGKTHDPRAQKSFAAVVHRDGHS